MSKLGKAGAVALFILAVPGAMLFLLALAPLVFTLIFAAELWWHDGRLVVAWRASRDLIMPGSWWKP